MIAMIPCSRNLPISYIYQYSDKEIKTQAFA